MKKKELKVNVRELLKNLKIKKNKKDVKSVEKGDVTSLISIVLKQEHSEILSTVKKILEELSKEGIKIVKIEDLLEIMKNKLKYERRAKV